ncbi:hypothetical protein [Pseudomonas aeruginosa]|uniref:hypothetical protein n=1 Tax=Pseudomonas aeruginosa TaxID=287 RepID=UPI00136A0658|nr:hypothetical protein [Pseudomonas aeruginosa]
MEPVDLDHVQGMAIGAGGAEDLVPQIRPARPASSWWSRRPRSRPGDAHRRRRRRGPGAVDPSGLAGEQLVEPVDLDHVQGMAIGAGGAEHLVPQIRPARPASSWWSRRPRSRPGDAHRRRRRRGPGASEGEGLSE